MKILNDLILFFYKNENQSLNKVEKIIGTLPHEVFTEVYSYLDIKETGSFTLACRTFNLISVENEKRKEFSSFAIALQRFAKRSECL